MNKLERAFKEVFTIDYVEVPSEVYWDVEDILGEEFMKVFGHTIDDFQFTAFASNTGDDPRIHGRFRFCVYGDFKGGIKYGRLKKVLESMQSEHLTIKDIYRPEQTPGISFNGVYEDDNTTYIGGAYELRK